MGNAESSGYVRVLSFRQHNSLVTMQRTRKFLLARNWINEVIAARDVAKYRTVSDKVKVICSSKINKSTRWQFNNPVCGLFTRLKHWSCKLGFSAPAVPPQLELKKHAKTNSGCSCRVGDCVTGRCGCKTRGVNCTDDCHKGQHHNCKRFG